jgi:prepilin-type N-terminal cleavage/methylation domain-containing protein
LYFLNHPNTLESKNRKAGRTKLKTRAFTLIELLIVVAIIAILAAIAVPNFLEAQTRAKVSRNKADMRSVATALEAYAVDANKYPPPWDYNPAGPGRVWGTFSEIPGGPFHSRTSSYLTTPIAYMTSLPDDPFRATGYQGLAPNLKPVEKRHIYFNIPYMLIGAPTSQNMQHSETDAGNWFLYSVGPDRDEFNTPPGQSLNGLRVYRDYDPTNGTVSLGNIFRTQKTNDRIGVDPYFWTIP